LLEHTFHEINKSFREYSGLQGLEQVKAELLEFQKKFGGLPLIRDSEMSTIISTIRRGEWKDYGINSWNDLMKHVFGKITKNQSRFKGKEGLDNACTILRTFYKENSRIPYMRDKGMSGIRKAIARGEWDAWEIKRWSDLTILVFGKRNIPGGKYLGKEGLDLCVKILKEIHDKYNRLPTTRDKELKGILPAIKRGEWAEFKINTWNDLLMVTFGKISKKMNEYSGKNGLNEALIKIRAYQEEFGRNPSSKHANFSGIYNAIYRKCWVEFGVKKWRDLMDLAKKSRLKDELDESN
jgi:hypothetical protein